MNVYPVTLLAKAIGLLLVVDRLNRNFTRNQNSSGQVQQARDSHANSGEQLHPDVVDVSAPKA